MFWDKELFFRWFRYSSFIKTCQTPNLFNINASWISATDALQKLFLDLVLRQKYSAFQKKSFDNCNINCQPCKEGKNVIEKFQCYVAFSLQLCASVTYEVRLHLFLFIKHKNAFQWDEYCLLFDRMSWVSTQGEWGVRPGGSVCWGGAMWPIPSCTWCYLYAASTPTETQQQWSCLYTAGWSCDLQGMLGYTPSLHRGKTDTCEKVLMRWHTNSITQFCKEMLDFSFHDTEISFLTIFLHLKNVSG